MGTSLDDLVTGMRILFHPQANRYDPHAPCMPFREEVFQEARSGKVTVGVIESLTSMPASESHRRAVRIAKEALERKGYRVVPIHFTPEEIAKLRDI